MLPVALSYIVIIAGAILGLDALGVPRGALYGACLFGLNVVLLFAGFVVVDRGHIISPASARVRAAELTRLRVIGRRAAVAGPGAASPPEITVEAGD